VAGPIRPDRRPLPVGRLSRQPPAPSFTMPEPSPPCGPWHPRPQHHGTRAPREAGPQGDGGGGWTQRAPALPWPPSSTGSSTSVKRLTKAPSVEGERVGTTSILRTNPRRTNAHMAGVGRRSASAPTTSATTRTARPRRNSRSANASSRRLTRKRARPPRCTAQRASTSRASPSRARRRARRARRPCGMGHVCAGSRRPLRGRRLNREQGRWMKRSRI